MQAIILAAGMGRRLGEFTANNTKCMLEVNGIRLIDRMLSQLSVLNLSRVVVVIGYEGQNLKNYISKNIPIGQSFLWRTQSMIKLTISIRFGLHVDIWQRKRHYFSSLI